VVAVLVLTVEVASFDLRFGGGLVRERYLFYLAPLLLVGFCAAVTAVRPPRWSLCVPLLVLAFGFSKAPLSAFEKLNVDTPASVLNNWLLGSLGGINGVRIFLVLASVVLAVAYVEGALLLPRTALTIALSVLLLAALPAETGYAFKRLFAVNGTSGLPLTLDQSVVFGWVDREITTNSEAVMVPYPVIRADFWSNIGFWWDLEFWNRSVDREAGRPSQFSGTPPGSFPKIDLRFDPRTGKANFDVDSYVAQAADDVRFHVKGRLLTTQRGVSIVFPDRPWRADWVSYGLWPDGWTRPHRTARIRVFPDLRQKTARERTLTLTLVTPESVPRRAVSLRSNSGSWTAEVTAAATEQVVTLCVPPGRPADVTLSTAGATPIYGDQSTIETSTQAREAGVLVGQIVLSDAPGVSCAPSRRRP
jgi:hypothetical protein